MTATMRAVMPEEMPRLARTPERMRSGRSAPAFCPVKVVTAMPML